MDKKGLVIKNLNAKQKQAVEQIDGPLMVIAGPGTGKTQLLSTRAAHIVQQTDISPYNILCLTYTDAAASEMRNRMQEIMGPTGGDISVHTFHSFGKWIIDSYPDYFSQEKSLTNIDDIAKKQIISSLLNDLPFRNKLRRKMDDDFTHRNNLEKLIEAIKKSGRTIDQIKAISKANKEITPQLNELINDIYLDKLSIKNIDIIHAKIEKYASNMSDNPLNIAIITQLRQAVEECIEINKTPPLGEWRRKHTEKQNGENILKTQLNQHVTDDALELYEQYQQILNKRGLYDYDDMINWAASAMSNNNDLVLDLAEQFQYIMVDEYQDTNGAQNTLLDNLLSANPIDEPNIMVVGDDDQAIMHFQGAEYSGMLKFIKKYNPNLIVLEDNYRSSEKILKIARDVITSTDERLEVLLKEVQLSKQLTANKKDIKSRIGHIQYETPIVQYIKVAEHISDLINKQGILPHEIAVICAKHKQLVSFTKYLSDKNIKFTYSRMENVLENSIIQKLLNLAEYVCRLGEEKDNSEKFLPPVLADEYLGLDPLDYYRIASGARSKKSSWLDFMLSSQNTKWQDTAEMLIALGGLSKTTDFTTMLDYLIGRNELSGTKLNYSPFKKYLDPTNAQEYVRLLTNLIKLRSKVLDYNPKASKLRDFLDSAYEYRDNDINIFNDSPLLAGSIDGVQILSAHGSKGKEFKHVIILSAVDEIWGRKSRANNQKIYLPEDLPLYTKASSESDFIRLIYVAITRAKEHLLLTSYKTNDNGKNMTNLAVIYQEVGNLLEPKDSNDKVENIIEAAEATWNVADKPIKASLQTILKPYIDIYRLSASALQSFVDVRYGGPQAFIEKSLLKFPSAYTENTALGSAAHSAIELAYRNYKTKTKLSKQDIIDHLDIELDKSGLSITELKSARRQAHKVVPNFIDIFTKTDFEKIISTEEAINTTIKDSGVNITGKLDAIEEMDNAIHIVDYKTGEPPLYGWESSSYTPSKQVGLHFNEMQLYFYKILLDASPIYTKQVTSAELVFVESAEDKNSKLVKLVISEFDENKVRHVKQLIEAVAKIIKSGNYPDISIYPESKKGILDFEKALIGTLN